MRAVFPRASAARPYLASATNGLPAPFAFGGGAFGVLAGVAPPFAARIRGRVALLPGSLA
ncbi:MAG: hypothetical protein ABSB82_01545 [Terriglobia bacterium]